MSNMEEIAEKEDNKTSPVKTNNVMLSKIEKYHRNIYTPKK